MTTKNNLAEAVVIERTFAAPVARVWKALTDVGEMKQWYFDLKEFKPEVGFEFEFTVEHETRSVEPAQGCEQPALTEPVTDYGHDLGCTVIGGGVYRGADQPALAGGYVFGDYCSGRIWAIDPGRDDYRAPTVVGDSSSSSLSAFGEDEAGELYAADIRGGAILRVTATTR